MMVMLPVLVALAAGTPNPRTACGCPSPRLLQRGPAILDDKGAVSAWLHDGAELQVFQQDPVDKQKLTPVDDAPIAVDSLGDDARFVRVHATGPLSPGAYLGIMRNHDTSPRDVVAISGSGGSPAVGPAPSLKALWLAPLEARERAACGSWLTYRIAFELNEGSPQPEAFLVEDAHTGKKALVDARYAGVYGLGRVELCEQGIAFAAGSPTHIMVTPVSSSFGQGDAWRFDSDGTGQTDLTRTQSPPSADRGRLEDPFPVPGADDHRGPTLKALAVGIMSVAVGGAAVIALLVWVVIPMRRRRMADIQCPSCAKKVPYDALDKETDGFFCPSCGAAGFWKGAKVSVDATRL